MTTVVYRDISNSFEPNPNTGDVSVVTNSDAIRQSMRNLVLTNFRERLQQPDKGSNVTGSLFELATPLTKAAFESDIITVLNNYEPRVIVQSVSIVEKMQENAYKVNISYIEKISAKPLTFDFLLTRVR